MARQTPLYAEHLRLQAKMTDYAGWLMPVQYPAGITAEHQSVRQQAGLFDVSHMGEILICGRDAVAFLNALLPRDLSRMDQAIERRQALYSVMCAADGTTVDDLLIYPLAPDQYLLVVNAANTDADERHIRTVLDQWRATREADATDTGVDVTIENCSDSWAEIALQGPLSSAVIGQLPELPGVSPDGLPHWQDAVTALGRYRFLTWCDDTDLTLLISRTGYTGEDGYEFYLRPANAVRLWRLLLEAGAIPAGLGARDTLRLEAGMPLYGHELSASITPREAGLDRFLALDKPEYVGRIALLADPRRTLIGLISEGKAIPRADYSVSRNGEPVGYVTSGTFSPTLSKGIAMALVDVDFTIHPDGSGIDRERSESGPAGPNSRQSEPVWSIEIRGRQEPFTRCPLPFV